MKRIVQNSRLVFIKQMLQDFHHTGAVAPSSKYLARSITKKLQNEHTSHPLKVLEVGAGTGVFTNRMMEILPEKSELDIYECNSFFTKELEKKIQNASQEVTLYQDYIQNLEKKDYYDYIVCGLPFNNFDPPLIENIFEIMIHSLRQGGSLSFFEYLAVRPLKSIFSCERETRRLKGVARIFRRIKKIHSFEKDIIFRNLPPATYGSRARSDHPVAPRPDQGSIF